MTNETLTERLAGFCVKIVRLSEEDGGGFLAWYEELGTFMKGVGETQVEAVSDLVDAVEDALEGEDLTDMPRPASQMPWSSHSGRVTLRMPKNLHCQAERVAREQGESLNGLLVDIIRAGVTALASGQEFGIVPKRGNPLQAGLDSPEYVLRSRPIESFGPAPKRDRWTPNLQVLEGGVSA